MACVLPTWEWSGDHAKPVEKVVAIFNPRLGAERVRELVELLYYIQSGASLSEKLSWEVDRSCNPYPAQFGSLNGAPWQGWIHCGHNPWLFARLVDDLWVEIGDDGTQEARWSERPSRILLDAPMNTKHGVTVGAQLRLRKLYSAILESASLLRRRLEQSN